MNLLKKAFLSFGGLGYFPIASGTWGSAGAAAVFAVICVSGVNMPMLSVLTAILAVVFTLLTGIYGGWGEDYWGKKDPGYIVTDEVAGYFVAVTMFVNAPWWLVAAAGFVFFRFFDIVKLPPANVMEKIPRGWGVALDDVIAGVYACVCTHAFVLAVEKYI